MPSLDYLRGQWNRARNEYGDTARLTWLLMDRYKDALMEEAPDSAELKSFCRQYIFCVDHLERAMGLFHEKVLEEINYLGVYLYNAKDYQNAILAFQKARARYRKIYGDEHYDTLLASKNLAAALLQVRRFQESLELRQEIIATLLTSPDTDIEELIWLYYLATDCAYYLGRYQLALELVKKGLDLQEYNALSEEDDTIFNVKRIDLAYYYLLLGRKKEQLEVLRENVRLFQARWGVTDRKTLSSMKKLSETLCDYSKNSLVRYAEIEEAYDRTERYLRLARMIYGQTASETIQATRHLADCLVWMKKDDEAQKILEDLWAQIIEAEKIRIEADSAEGNNRHGADMDAGIDLVRLYIRGQDYKKASGLAERLLAILVPERKGNGNGARILQLRLLLQQMEGK